MRYTVYVYYATYCVNEHEQHPQLVLFAERFETVVDVVWMEGMIPHTIEIEHAYIHYII